MQTAFNDAKLDGYLDRWSWCNKCQGLTFAGNAVTGGNPNPTPGPCPAGGVHDHAGGGTYWLTTGTEANLPFLVTPDSGQAQDWQPGQTFSDPNENVFIRVESMNASPGVALATITIGPASS